MISLEQKNLRFNFRVAGLAIHNQKILVHRYEDYDFWALPGGRAELGEDSNVTVKREFKEELNEDILVDRLLWCSERFFNFEGVDYHELCFYYLIRFPSESPLLDIEGEFVKTELDGSKLTFRWVEMDLAKSIELYPTFLRKRLHQLPEQVEHIITYEE